MTTPPPGRTPEHEIDALFVDRWSPRAFTDEPISTETLLGFFEAARWAPSGGNSQPWRFVYARRGTPAFEVLLGALVPANQAWAKGAAALVALASNTLLVRPGRPPTPASSHSFDAGAAWVQFALQAHLRGWATHAMGGFDRERAHAALAIPADHRVEVFIAVGRRGDAASLPEPLRARETPSDRKSMSEFVDEGAFRPR